MQFTMKEAVSIDNLPEPPTGRGRRGQLKEVFDKIAALPRGRALPITFKENKDAPTARGALRKIAKRQDEVLSSTREQDGRTFYFWIEPKDAASPQAIQRKTGRAA